MLRYVLQAGKYFGGKDKQSGAKWKATDDMTQKSKKDTPRR